MKVNVIFAILLAAVLILSMTTSALAMGSQLWYLDSETTAAGFEMEKDNNDGQTGSVAIAANSSAVWLADQAAVCDVTFPGNDAWIIHICTDDDWGTIGDKCEVSIGGWNTTAEWYEIPTTTIGNITWDSGKNILKVELQADPATIYQGDYLALEVKNNDSVEHPVDTEGCSSLSSPCGDPGYPVPELSSAILLGAGLIGLVGYLGIRRRKASV